MVAYFTQCSTPQQVKNLVRDLLMQFHPDKHREKFDHYNDITRGILEQYHIALESFDGYKAVNADTGREWVYKYYPELEERIQDKIQELIGLNLPDDVLISIVGLWIWVEGNTKPHRKVLGSKGVGLIYSGTRKAWRFKPYGGKTWYSNRSTERIKSWYGVTVVGQGSAEGSEDQGSNPALGQ